MSTPVVRVEDVDDLVTEIPAQRGSLACSASSQGPEISTPVDEVEPVLTELL